MTLQNGPSCLSNAPAMTPDDAYHELCYYTLTLGDAAFIHQHVVDAFAAQQADEQTKPIKLTFALVDLFLHVEKQFSGKLVQRVHMDLARQKHVWPSFTLPQSRGDLTAVDVLAFPAGPQRDQAIDAWCTSVWEAYRDCRQTVIDLLREQGLEIDDQKSEVREQNENTKKEH